MERPPHWPNMPSEPQTPKPPLSREDLEHIQRYAAPRALSDLAMRCRQRWLDAADVVALSGPVVERVRRLGMHEPIDVWPFLPVWEAICNRYISEHYSPQLPLFPDLELDPETRWWRFVYRKLYPVMEKQGHVVRNVLRAVGALPAKEPAAAVEAVRQFVVEMYMPYDMWIDERDDL